jgi:hypothetical protein
MTFEMSRMQGATNMMQTTLKLAVLAAGTLVAAQAATIDFNFKSTGTNTGSGYGNERTFTSGDVTVTASAWGLSSLSSTFVAGQLGRANSVGLWACNASEGLNCPSPQHQIDNSYGYDFILFEFSTPVDPSSITIKSYNSADLDVSYWLGGGKDLSLAGVSYANLSSLFASGHLFSDSNPNSAGRTVSLVNDGGVNALLVGARVGGDRYKDYFKLSALSVDTVSDVPEPGTFLLSGAALAALGLIGRRKRS